jgi:hypothetical protein
MKKREEIRRFWSEQVARFEASGKTRKEFAAEAGVGLAIFQYWLYKLRRERGGALVRRRADGEVRLVPVRVRPPQITENRSGVEVRVAGVRMRVRVGVDPAYVASLVVALRRVGP